MGKNFVATTVTKTASANRVIEITLSDGSGKTHTLCASVDLAQTLAQIFSDLSKASPTTTSLATKLPSTFAVGSGQYEPLVLIRFERDAPYGMCVEDAAELGRAILEQAETVSQMLPAPVH